MFAVSSFTGAAVQAKATKAAASRSQLAGKAEAYRTGLVDPAFDELTVGDANPGGRFDPLNLAESGDLDELKLKELKHCRLAMFAWLGCISQAVWTKEGPIANWSAHVADPVHVNSMKYAREYWTSISL